MLRAAQTPPRVTLHAARAARAPCDVAAMGGPAQDGEDGSGDGFVDVGEEGGDGSIGTIVQGSIIEGTTFGGDSDGNPGTTEKQTKCKRAFHVFHFEI